MEETWFTLGFTDEDVCVAWQHQRLAHECELAFARRGLPPAELLESPGEGRYMLLWHVSPSAAHVLDDEGVHWRRFLVGERLERPAVSHAAVRAR